MSSLPGLHEWLTENKLALFSVASGEPESLGKRDVNEYGQRWLNARILRAQQIVEPGFPEAGERGGKR